MRKQKGSTGASRSKDVSMNPIDEYIEAQAPEVQPILKKTREMISQALPDCKEKISYAMPTYR